MNLSKAFIERPVATTLLTAAIALAGAMAFRFLPVAPLPQIDFPTISVQAQLPGASAEIMAASVATPLERQFGRIAGVTEMTSASSLGSTSVTLQFALDRDINGAARDVEAAINAARSYLPSNLPANPSYRKVNPADAPIMILGLTSKVYDRGAMYDAASTIIQQKLSQIQGVGQVNVGGSSLPAVRVEADPGRLNALGLGLPDVAAVLSAQNSNLAKGALHDDQTATDILANDQLLKAEGYRSLIVGYHQGAAVRLADVARVDDSIQNIRSAGYLNGKPAVLLIIFRVPGANIIDTVDRIYAALPSLKASIPAAMEVTVSMDRTQTIRASVREVERTLLISIVLVILVVFAFLRSPRATLIPSVAVPVSLVGTFGAMYLLGYSLDNLSLMALTISTGFVVDDAIVVIENISRHLERGMRPVEAALQGAREIGFTVLSISISLVAVFIPILMMGGIVGRLLREFAVTLSVAIGVSMLVSLTTTPMMCSRLLRREGSSKAPHGRLYRGSEAAFEWAVSLYERTLRAVLGHPALTLSVLLLTVAANLWLLYLVPKGFFPEQDNGTVFGGIQGTQDISFQSMDRLAQDFVNRIKTDPAVENVMAFTGGSGATNTGFIYLGLKPLEERKIDASRMIGRLRPALTSIPGASVFLQAGQDLRIGGRQSSAQYQYTIQSESVGDLVLWGPKLLEQVKKLPGFVDVNTDQQNKGLDAYLSYDRETASRVGVTPRLLDSTLYDSFGQALVSTMYTPLNQYYVVLEAEPAFVERPGSLQKFYIHSPGGVVPLEAVSSLSTRTAALAVNHQGQFPAVTISFNLAPGVALSDAANAIATLERRMGLPASIRGMFTGTLQAFQESLGSEGVLVLTALLTVYIVLGILYESAIHPITILSTIPSAGVGAVLMLLLFRLELSVIALIGMILLIGIVKKNAILMIDFAIALERAEGRSPREAIFEACLLRFRPILMTTMAALLGAVPLAIGTGTGSELRRPLGITIIGGLVFSQLLTLYTTPVVYLYLDRVRLRLRGEKDAGSGLHDARPGVLFWMHGRAELSAPRPFRRSGGCPAAFKELDGGKWQTAHPNDDHLRGKWWEIYDDQELNALEEQVSVSNLNIAASFAAFQQARAMVREARAQYSPTVSVAPAISAQGGQAGVSNTVAAVSGTFAQYTLPVEASWQPDLWGKIRRQVESQESAAQVSAADLENERLSQQGALAITYYELRAQDSLRALYDKTVANYRETLKLTNALARTGIDSDENVAQAETQLETAEAQATGLGIARAQYEHAIALLVGKSPSNFSLSEKPLQTAVPAIPVGLPSRLLERRPDVAAAERSMAAANAQIGVATAAYYPNLSLDGSAGIGSNNLRGLLSTPLFVWSLGATLTQTIFDGGLRSATVDQYRAAFDQTVATYRQTVLTAFQQVEDALAALRLLATEVKQQNSAVLASDRFLMLALHRYRLGIDPYLNVVAAQLSVLTNRQTLTTLRMQQMTASVQLIEALGGGWEASTLPAGEALSGEKK